MRPVDRSSTLITRWPSASRRSARCEPMNPAPPVTRTVLTRVNLSCGSAAMSSEVRSPRAHLAAPEAGDHRGVVGAQRHRREQHLEPLLLPGRREALAQPRVRDDAAAQQHRGRADVLRGGDRLRHLHVDDRLLEACGQIGQVQILTRRPRRPSRGAARPSSARSSRSRSRRSPAIARGKRIAWGSPWRRHRVERRTPREPESDQPGHLVEGLPRRVVERLAEHDVVEHLRHVHEHRVSAAHDQRHVGRSGAVRAPGSSPSSDPRGGAPR